MPDIDDFIKSEEAKMNWLNRAMSYPKASTTRSLSANLEKVNLGRQTMIKPSLFDKFIAIIIFLFAGLVWIALLNLLLERRSPFVIIFFAFLFITFLIFYLIRNSFFNKKYIYTISVDAESITIDTTRFNWNEIAETYILNRWERKRTNSYLIISNKDGTFKKFDLFKFAISDRKLSTIIEYYRSGLKMV